MKKTGWYNRNKTGNTPKYESHRHSLASKGIKTTLPKGAKGFSSVGSPTPNFDMVAKDNNLNKSYRLGIKAYKDDIIRAPTLDKDFKNLLKKAKNPTPLLLSWINGWDEAKYRHKKEETDMVSGKISAVTYQGVEYLINTINKLDSGYDGANYDTVISSVSKKMKKEEAIKLINKLLEDGVLYMPKQKAIKVL